uniref:Uncharacterized protein n=1 Tax=Glossina palpalis gambiensis TaxID=67801 RepID=A0A1B0BRU1_9MUSC
MYTTAQISAFNIFIEAIHQPQASQSNERVNTSTSMPSSKAKGSCDGSVKFSWLKSAIVVNIHIIPGQLSIHCFFQSSPPVRSVKRIMATDIDRLIESVFIAKCIANVRKCIPQGNLNVVSITTPFQPQGIIFSRQQRMKV